jgi:hypothetical protein
VAISPGIYNFTIRRRSDHSERFDFCDDAGDPIDLSGWTAKAEAWLKGRTLKIFDFTVDSSALAQGSVRISVNSLITASLPNELEYDVLLTSSTGLREYYVAGTILVVEGYTT